MVLHCGLNVEIMTVNRDRKILTVAIVITPWIRAWAPEACFLQLLTVGTRVNKLMYTDCMFFVGILCVDQISEMP